MRKAAMTASDIVTAKPFAKPFIPSLGKRIKPIAISATATAAAMWETIGDIFFTVLIFASANNRRFESPAKSTYWNPVLKQPKHIDNSLKRPS
jgi:hypothetical protein